MLSGYNNAAVWNKLTTVPVDFFGRLLMLTDDAPSNRTVGGALLKGNPRGIVKRREVERPLAGLPSISKPSYSVAVSKQMLSFLAGVVHTSELPPGSMESVMSTFGRCKP